MKFCEIVEEYQRKNPGYIILARNGIFFNAIGKDAVILSKMLGLKNTCIKEKVCKCGIPVKNIEKYLQLILKQKKSIIIIDYKKEPKKEYEEILRVTADKVEETRCNIGCKNCPNKEKYKEENIYEKIKSVVEEVTNGG